MSTALYDFRVETDPVWIILWILLTFLLAIPFGVNAHSAITYRKA